MKQKSIQFDSNSIIYFIKLDLKGNLGHFENCPIHFIGLFQSAGQNMSLKAHYHCIFVLHYSVGWATTKAPGASVLPPSANITACGGQAAHTVW